MGYSTMTEEWELPGQIWTAPVPVGPQQTRTRFSGKPLAPSSQPLQYHVIYQAQVEI